MQGQVSPAIDAQTKKMVSSSDDLKKTNPFRKAGITGFAVICEMLTGGLFMENVKMEKQRTSDPYPMIMRRILRQGVAGFEAGFWPWGFTLGMTKGAVLGFARSFFLNVFIDSGMSKSRADVISGFCAGGVQGIFMSPIMVARTRVNQSIVERSAAGKVSQGFLGEMSLSMTILNDAIKKDGFGTLFVGMRTMVFKRSLDWGVRFVFFKQVKDIFYRRKEDPNAKLTNFEQLASAFIGGSAAVFVTMPIDRLMPILQAAGASKDQTIRQIVVAKLGREGLATLQRGLIMRVIHCGWHTTYAIFIASKIYDAVDKRF